MSKSKDLLNRIKNINESKFDENAIENSIINNTSVLRKISTDLIGLALSKEEYDYIKRVLQTSDMTELDFSGVNYNDMSRLFDRMSRVKNPNPRGTAAVYVGTLKGEQIVISHKGISALAVVASSSVPKLGL